MQSVLFKGDIVTQDFETLLIHMDQVRQDSVLAKVTILLYASKQLSNLAEVIIIPGKYGCPMRDVGL